MAVSIADYIDNRSPFDSGSSQTVKLIEMAELEIGNCFTGDLRNKAVALLVMHWLSLEARDGGSGMAISGSLTGEKEGDLSRNYGFNFGSGSKIKNPYLAQTQYGLELLSLMRTQFVLPKNRMIESC